MRIHDISQPLGEETAVWPGDRAVEIEWSQRRDRGDPVNVAALHASVHAGTHMDGFLHLADGGETAAEMPLDAGVGRCTVVDAIGCEEVGLEHVAGLDLARTERILFHTRDAVDATLFPQAFAAISPDVARALAAAGVRLVGTDAPSVDRRDAVVLETHIVCANARIAILESVVLTDVAPGEYSLIALPLRLVGADSSPVRAVLIEGAFEDGVHT
ncbi:MAG: cyclase family protein [Gemmatimonadota bacterium]